MPGSGIVKKMAEDEGLQEIFIDAGFEWRAPGCSMCLGMNPDQLKDGKDVLLLLTETLKEGRVEEDSFS